MKSVYERSLKDDSKKHQKKIKKCCILNISRHELNSFCMSEGLIQTSRGLTNVYI